jgi:hypothetical protein
VGGKEPPRGTLKVSTAAATGRRRVTVVAADNRIDVARSTDIVGGTSASAVASSAAALGFSDRLDSQHLAFAPAGALSTRRSTWSSARRLRPTPLPAGPRGSTRASFGPAHSPYTDPSLEIERRIDAAGSRSSAGPRPRSRSSPPGCGCFRPAATRRRRTSARWRRSRPRKGLRVAGWTALPTRRRAPPRARTPP